MIEFHHDEASFIYHKRFAPINIFKLSDDFLHLILFNKLLQDFVKLCL